MTAASFLLASDLPECKTFEAVSIPRGDQPTPEQAKALGDPCDSNDFYYGFSNPPNPVKARLCAYAEYSSENKDFLGFNGPTVLMMIYANGKGAARNFDLAMRFACELFGSGFPVYGGETRSRLQHLAKLKSENWKGSDFDFCDDAHSNESIDFCGNRKGFDYARVKKQMKAIESKWSVADKQAFAKVEQAEKEYTDAVQRNELDIDMTGTAWHSVIISFMSDMSDATISVLSRLESGKFPDSKNTGFAKADAKLNALYNQKIRELKKREVDGTLNAAISADGVRETERIWLKYLVAWIAFVQKKYPLAPADSVRTWLTEARVKHIMTIN